MNHCRALFFPLLALLLSGCGNDGMVTATLITNLRSPTPFTNFMSKISSTEQFAVTSASTCIQSQVYAIYGDKSITGGAIQKMTSIPVTLSTPLATYPGPIPTTWLNASTLQPVQFSVLKGTTIQFGIVGALYMSLTASSDGTCPIMNPSTSPAYPNPSFSIMGHSEATILGDTTLPLSLWIADSQPINSLGLPTTSPSSLPAPSACSPTAGADFNNLYSQNCPNLNFTEINLVKCSLSSTCSGSTYAEIQYFKTLNSTHTITHRVIMTGLTTTTPLITYGAKTSIGAIVPAMDWYSTALMDTSGNTLETAKLDFTKTGPSPTPQFISPTGVTDSALAFLSATGIRTGPIATASTQNLSGTNQVIPITFTPMPGAVYYNLMGSIPGPSPIPVTSQAPITFSINVDVGFQHVSSGVPTNLTIVATDATGLETTSNVMKVTPVGTIGNPPSLSAGTSVHGSINVNFNIAPLPPGATKWKIERGPPGSTDPSDFTSAGSGVYYVDPNRDLIGGTYLITGLATGTIGVWYYFRYTAFNDQFGSAVTGTPTTYGLADYP